MSARALGLAAAIVAFALASGSASANPIPFFYLVPSGPTTVPTVVPVGTTTYQLWGDPTGVTTPAGCLQPINGSCNGILGTNLLFLADAPTLTITGFTPYSALETQFTLPSCFFSVCGISIDTGTGSLAVPGEDLPFEIGNMTINNSGEPACQTPPCNGPGEIVLFEGQYTDTNFNNHPVTTPQTIVVAAPAPEPGTGPLLVVGIGGLVAVRTRRLRVT